VSKIIRLLRGYTARCYLLLRFRFRRVQKENLKQIEAQEEQRLLRCQKDYLEIEIRKFKRKKLLSYHVFEQELLREVSAKSFGEIF
jgi:hypothetical protein